MSEPMLARLRGSAAKLGLSPRLYHADMSDFRLPRQYALIMIPFNSFTHILTQETQIRCLERCREHLLRSRHSGETAIHLWSRSQLPRRASQIGLLR
jgi:hypothetical protein